MNIIPYTEKFENIESARVSWSYLHGQLEDDAGYDCFGVQGVDEVDGKAILKEGIYSCSFNDKECTLYYWCCSGIEGHKGLAVYNDDEKSVKYAKKCFDNKESFI